MSTAMTSHIEPAAETEAVPVLLEVHDVAGILRCHPATVRALIASGELVGFKLSRTFRVQASDLKEFVLKRRAAGPSVLTDADQDAD